MATNLQKTIRKIAKNKVWRIIKGILLVIAGCAILAIADAVFLEPINIISGGVYSIGVIVQHFWSAAGRTGIVGDIVVAIINVLFFLLGFIFLGKKFAGHTLLATLAYPAFYSLFLRIDLGRLIGFGELYDLASPYYQSGAIVEGATQILNPAYIGYVFLFGIFGGALTGIGVALALLGGGSTGGIDILGAILEKYTIIKHDVTSFVADVSIIIVGIITMRVYATGLVGIVAAFVCAMAIDLVYVHLDAYEIVVIISDKWKEIQTYVHDEYEHASTVYDAVGGYTGEDRKVLNVVIYHSEIDNFRSVIADIDPKAFVTFTTARTINGEGFAPLPSKANEPWLIKKIRQAARKRKAGKR